MVHGLDWKNILSQPEDENAINSIRNNSHTGRPLGTDSFMSKLEHHLGRRIRPLKVGRPKRKKLPLQTKKAVK